MAIGKKEKSKFVVSVGDEGSIITHIVGKEMVNRAFATTPSSSDFTNLISSDPDAEILIYVDVVDQSYTQHSMPPVSQMNVKKLIARKLEKDYDATDLKDTICIGRDKAGKKEWTYLFISVRIIPPLSDWVDAVFALPNPFGGIYLLPIEVINTLHDIQKATAKKMPNPSQWKIVVSHNRVGGFRQMVFKDDNILFTRMAQPIGGQTSDVIAGNIEQETLNTIEYIRRLGFEDTAGLDVFIITSNDVKRVLDIKAKTANPPMILTPAEAAQLLDIPSAAEGKDRFGDVLLAMHFALSKKHVLKLQTDPAKKVSSIEKAIIGVKVATGLIILGLFGYTGYNMINAFSASSDIEASQQKKNSAQLNLSKAQKKFSDFEGDIDRIREFSSFDTKFISDKNDVFTLISKVGNIEGYNLQASEFKASVTRKDNEPAAVTSSYTLTLSPSVQVDSGKAAALIDEFDALNTDFKNGFSEYDVEFTNPPSEDAKYFAMSDDEAKDLTFDLNLKISGPKEDDDGKKKKRRTR
jgi:hypothetical protein